MTNTDASSADKTYAEAVSEVDARSDIAIQNFARKVGVYYKALAAETGNQQLALEGAERLAMIYEAGMAQAMMNAIEKEHRHG